MHSGMEPGRARWDGAWTCTVGWSLDVHSGMEPGRAQWDGAWTCMMNNDCPGCHIYEQKLDIKHVTYICVHVTCRERAADVVHMYSVHSWKHV